MTTTHVSPDMGGCRLCERMSDITLQELAGAIVRDAVHRYIESRRGRIDAFVDRHFTLAGSAALHRRALGWDLLRAPANLFLAGPALAVKLMACAARRAGMERWRHGLPAAGSSWRPRSHARSSGWWQPNCSKFRVDAEIGSSYRDAIAETILADERAAALLVAPARRGPRFSPPARRRGRDLSRLAHRNCRDRDRLCRRRVSVPWSSNRRPRVW